MTITHHLDDATLLSFAAGGLPEALAVVAALHIDMCPRCAREARRMDRLGGALLDTLSPVAVVTPPREARSPERPGSNAGGAVPPSLESLMGGDLDHARWRFLAFGVEHAPLALSPGVKGSLRLIKAAPRQAIPDHGHGGAELTLVLRGAYSDKTGRYGPGDVADLDEDVEHRPIADPDTGCICILASETLTRFRGLVPRLAQPFTGI